VIYAPVRHAPKRSVRNTCYWKFVDNFCSPEKLAKAHQVQELSVDWPDICYWKFILPENWTKIHQNSLRPARYAAYPLPVLTDIRPAAAASKHTTTTPINHARPLFCKQSPDGATPSQVADILCTNILNAAKFCCTTTRTRTRTTTTTTTTVLRPFVQDYPGEPVPEETLTHPPSWSSSHLYQLLPSATIHSILPVQITCLAIFLHNLSPRPLWSTSWSGPSTSYSIHFFTQSVSFFSQHMPVASQSVLLWYQYYIIYS